MKKRVLIIIFIVIVALVGTGMFIFREQPLIPEGYAIQYVGGDVVYEDSTQFTWEADQTIIEYNPDFPDYRGSQFLTIDSDELLAILKTAKCRASLKSFGNHFSGDIKYQFTVVLENGGKVRHLNIYLGLSSVVTVGGSNYEILKAEELISVLDATIR